MTTPPQATHDITVALLTGGSDKPYVFGLTISLTSMRASLDLIGSDELDCPGIADNPAVRFLNLRGSLQSDAPVVQKLFRVATYYAKLIHYTVVAKPTIFHVLWNNRFEFFDRTLLMQYYRLMGKSVVLTVHNVNAGRRDLKDTRLNRLTLGIQYRSAAHIFVHTVRMKRELVREFHVRDERVTVIPFGINNAVPNSRLTSADAKRRLGIRESEKTILFFGRITPYKGLEYLISAFRQVNTHHSGYRLIIAGRPDRCAKYWTSLRDTVWEEVRQNKILLRPEFIPDNETEVYFKAADVAVLPYKDIYQSGVLFLGYSFGLPAIATDVGSFRENIVEGRTGFLCKPCDVTDLARALEMYFRSDLYRCLEDSRRHIREYVEERHSWDVVGRMTYAVYAGLEREQQA